MIILYILLIASVVAIFGLIVTIFSHIKKVNRSKRMGHFFLVFGVIIAIIAGFSMNKEKEAHQAAIAHQKKLQAEQIYDAGLVHINDRKVRIKNGQAKVMIYVSANTMIKIHSSHEQLHDLDYKPNKEKRDVRVTFVMPGKYTVTATRGQNKVVKYITVLKSNQRKTTSSSLSSSEIVSEASDDTAAEGTTVEDTSSETVVEPDITVSDSTDTTVTEVTPSTDYQPVWTPSTDTTTTDSSATADGTTNNTETSSDSATTDTTSVPSEQGGTTSSIGE